MGLSDEEREKLEELTEIDKDQLSDGEITSRVHLSLRRKYDYPEWALFFEVKGKNGRLADAIAYNLFPSRNFKTVGFEIKASRSDWKSELEDGEKADFFVGQCDEWYVVAGRKGIVKEHELPDGWGLLEMKGGGKLYTVVESDLTEHQDRPIDPEFYMRAVQKAMKRAKEAKREKKRARRQGYREGKEEGKKMDADMTREQERLIEKGERLEWLEEQGIRLWNKDVGKVRKIKRAMDLIDRINREGEMFGMLGAVNRLRDEADKIEETIKELQAETRRSDG